jgi:hypothetical protein
MRISRDTKTEKLCSGFLQLDGKEQEHIFGVLQGLLFAKLKTDSAILSASSPARIEEKKQG